MDFPTQPDELTNDWLSHALGADVRSHRVEMFGEGAGIMGQVTRVHLAGDVPNATIIAKFASPAPENRAVAGTYDMYGREVNFYQNLRHRIAMRTPECYYAAMDDDRERFIILMEDIRGYRIGDQVAGCTTDEAEAVVTALAEFHASGWDRSWDVTSHNNPAQRDGMIAGFQAGWPVVKARFADVLPDSALTHGDRVPNAVPRLLDMMCRPPVTLVHADVRLDNVFFGDDICLVDWQSVCTSAPEQDLAYFLTQSVPRDVQLSRDLKTAYYDALTSHGIDYSRTQFDERYVVSALYLMCYAVVIAGTLDMGNDRGVKLARTLLGGCLQALDDMNAFELL